MNRSLTPLRIFASASLVAVVLAACGSRGPLDDAAVTAAEAGATETGSSTTEDATTPTPTPTADAGADAEKEGGSIIECGSCLFTECSQGILACVQDPACSATFQCVVSDCLTGGSPNPACLLKCAGSPQGALKIFTIFQCVTQTCGGDCGDLLATILGGLGGLGGGGGGGGADAGKDAGKTDGGNKLAAEPDVDGERARRNMIGAFSRWPELLPRSE